MDNLTVAQAHTYFVGDGAWLVHNQCIPELEGTTRGKLLGQVKEFLRTFEGTLSEKANIIDALYTQVSQKSETRWVFDRFDLADGTTIFEGPGGFHTVVDVNGKLWKGGPADYTFDRNTNVVDFNRLHDFFE